MIGMMAGALVAAVVVHGSAQAMRIGANPAENLADASLCAAQAARQEQAQNIPPHLLDAISLVESGRYDAASKADVAWPWTVDAEGQGNFFPTKDAAIAFVRREQAKGITNIDVGCMQVNLQAHSDAFATLEDAFDPVVNVAYAARFLVGLHNSTGNWPTAAGYYHSQTPALASAYRQKLQVAWEQIRDGKAGVGFQLAGLENRPPAGLLYMTSGTQSFDPESTVKVVAAQGAAAYARTQAEQAEAKRIADAYRSARLEEYRLRKLELQAKKPAARG
jgi:hypothetical protein